MTGLTEAVATRLLHERGQQFDRVVGIAAEAAWEACRVLRNELRGGERPPWGRAPYEEQRRWRQRSRAVALGECGSVRALYGLVMHLEAGEALDRAWEDMLDWRLVELVVEFATLRTVWGGVLPEGAGAVLLEARRGDA